MELEDVNKKKLQKIFSDPVLWSQAFLKTFNPKKKIDEPWTARWYQAEMLRDNSLKKVYRCGRRTGDLFCPYAVNCGNVL